MLLLYGQKERKKGRPVTEGGGGTAALCRREEGTHKKSHKGNGMPSLRRCRGFEGREKKNFSREREEC
jgi:hypothetical protein